jgi:hypothetical protein
MELSVVMALIAIIGTSFNAVVHLLGKYKHFKSACMECDREDEHSHPDD